MTIFGNRFHREEGIMEKNTEDSRQKLTDLKQQYDLQSMKEADVVQMKSRMQQAKRENASARRGRRIRTWVLAAAAAFAVLIVPNTSQQAAHAMGSIPVIGNFFQLVTFREYHEDTGDKVANVNVDKIKTNENASDAAKKSTEEINQEIGQLTDKYVDEFKSSLNDKGYDELQIDTEVVDKTSDYFTLKLSVYAARASGYEEDHYYTISLDSGERIHLADLFKDGSDYKDVLVKYVQSQIAADTENTYFSSSQLDHPLAYYLTDDSFYLDQDGHLVIVFNEGDIGPMSSGTLTFTIPDEVIASIRK